MATAEQVYTFLKDHARGSLSRQTNLSAAITELTKIHHESVGKGACTYVGDGDLSRVESQVSTMDIPDERGESELPALRLITRLPKESTLATLYREVLQHQSHQFEMRLGGLDCVVVTNCMLEEAQVVALFLHGLGASPWHFVKLGTSFLQDYVSQQVLKKGKFFDCKAAFIFPFGLISMAENEFGAVEDTVFGSYKWWDIFNGSGSPLTTQRSTESSPPTQSSLNELRPRNTPLGDGRRREGFSPSPSSSTLDTDYSHFIKEHAMSLAEKEPYQKGVSKQASPVATPSFQRGLCWCLKPEHETSGQTVNLTPRGWTGPPSTAPLDDPVGRPKATAAVTRLIHILRTEYGNPRLVLGGFSQGAMLALDVFFNLESPPHFLAIFSGAPMCIETWKQRITTLPAAERHKLKSVPILESHGSRDWVFPVFVGRWLNRFLRRNGFWTRYIEFDGEHELSEEAITSYNDVIFQLALEGTLGLQHITSKTSQQSVASPSNQLPGFTKLDGEQPSLQETFDDFLYRAGYAVAACVLPVAKKIG